MKIVGNSSVLIALAKLGQLHLLKAMYRRIYIPRGVAEEVSRKPTTKQEAKRIQEADFIRVRKARNLLAVNALRTVLGSGESEMLVLAKELGAEVALLDDKQAREKARALGFDVTGTVGILGLAKRLELVEEVKPLLDELMKKGFHIGPELYAAALQDAGEA